MNPAEAQAKLSQLLQDCAQKERIFGLPPGTLIGVIIKIIETILGGLGAGGASPPPASPPTA